MSRDAGVDEWEIPKKAHTDLIGKGGSTVRDICSKFNVRVTIPKRDDPSRTVRVVGDPESREKAKAEMEKLLGWPIYKAPLGRLVLRIPCSFHGKIIGSGASTLNSLESKHGCNIAIARAFEKSELVELEGPPASLDCTRGLLEATIGRTVDVEEEYRPTGSVSVALPFVRRFVDLSPDSGVIEEGLFFEDDVFDEEVFERFLDFLRSARKSIDVAVFNLTHKDIVHTLTCAFKQGVEVRLIVDDVQAKGAYSGVSVLQDAGIEVRQDASTENHMHHKFCVLDGHCLLSGSFNWTQAACRKNAENILVTNRQTLVQQYQAQFEKMWNKYGGGESRDATPGESKQKGGCSIQ